MLDRRTLALPFPLALDEPIGSNDWQSQPTSHTKCDVGVHKFDTPASRTDGASTRGCGAIADLLGQTNFQRRVSTFAEAVRMEIQRL